MSHFSYLRIGPGDDRPRFPEPRPAQPGQWPKLEAALAVVNRDVVATLPGQEPLVLMVHPPWEPPAPREDEREDWEDAADAADALARETQELNAAREPVYVAMPDGRSQGNAVNMYDLEEGDPPEPHDEATVLATVADAAQETVSELLWQVWPVCWEHKIGVHVRPAGTTADWYQGYQGEPDAGGPPVWWCRGGRDGACHDVAPIGELAATLPGKQRRALRRSRREQS